MGLEEFPRTPRARERTRAVHSAHNTYARVRWYSRHALNMPAYACDFAFRQARLWTQPARHGDKHLATYARATFSVASRGHSGHSDTLFTVSRRIYGRMCVVRESIFRILAPNPRGIHKRWFHISLSPHSYIYRRINPLNISGLHATLRAPIHLQNVHD